ncbi:MAG TPA: helix-turn-helix domain-containing protein [Patescibacteria group bacterium]|nr:helix-turn-helix domain-containing protein [Patescibacteria group bacterium]
MTEKITTHRVPAEVFPPGELIREELEARGWTQTDLAEILGRPLKLVSDIILGKRTITPETAKGLGDAFGVDPQFFLNLESAYQLWRVGKTQTRGQEVSRRARLYDKVPIRELLRRHWIEHSESIDVLEQRVLNFYGIKNITDEPKFWPVAAKTSAPELTLAHWAWLARARYIARALTAAQFSESSLPTVIEELKTFLHTPEEVRHVPKMLAEAGIRLVLIEHLPSTKIDGACFWLDLDPRAPVIVLSLRYDRIDHFWHTLFHELGHLREKHGLKKAHHPFDVDIFGETAPSLEQRPEAERIVNDFAANTLVPTAELNDWIARVGPLYSKEAIRGFAGRLKIHPGIVVGQLQHRHIIDWRYNREMLAHVRQFLVHAALTDGWGQVVPLAVG